MTKYAICCLDDKDNILFGYEKSIAENTLGYSIRDRSLRA